MEIKDWLDIDWVISNSSISSTWYSLGILTPSITSKIPWNYIRVSWTWTFTDSMISWYTKRWIILTIEFLTAWAVIQHNATALPLPWWANITVSAWDKIVLINPINTIYWKVVNYIGWTNRWQNTWDETNATIKTKLWVATTTTDWYLNTIDWNTFNNKQNTLPQANTTTNWYLSYTDWNTFNNKVSWPTTATTWNLVLFNSTDWKVVKDSWVLLDPTYIDFWVRQLYSSEILALNWLVIYDLANIKSENDFPFLSFLDRFWFNQIQIWNNTTWNAPTITATWSEANIWIDLYTKWAWEFKVNWWKIVAPLSYILKSTDITTSWAWTTMTVSWTTQTNVFRYKVYSKLASSWAINIYTDTPIIVNAPTITTNITVVAWVEYNICIVCEIWPLNTEIKVANNPLIMSYTVDSIQNWWTSAVLSWTSLWAWIEYRISYNSWTSLNNPTIITTTNSTYTITWLTWSNENTWTISNYTFNVNAYSTSSWDLTSIWTATTSVIMNLIKPKLFYTSSSSLNITNLTRLTTVATATTSSEHWLVQWDVIDVGWWISSPFNVWYVLVSSVPSTTTFTYTVLDSWATSVSSWIIANKYSNAFVSWNTYKYKTALSSLETTTKKFNPRITDIYRNPSNYSSELIFPVNKYLPNSWDYMAWWHLIEPKTWDWEKVVLCDLNWNSSILMKRATYSYEWTPLNKLFYGNDDNRSYKIWHWGWLKVNKTNNWNLINQEWMELTNNFTENIWPSYLTPYLPTVNPLTTSISSVVVANLLTTWYTVYFDNANQKITWQYKTGWRETTVTYASLGISSIISGWSYNNYCIHDNVSKVTVGTVAGYAYTFNFNFQTGMVTVGSQFTGINTNYNATEENAFSGYEFMTYYNLDTNSCEIISYTWGTTNWVYISNSSAIHTTSAEFTNMAGAGTYKTMLLPTDTAHNGACQCGMNPVPFIDGSNWAIYWCDWWHDDNWLYSNWNDTVMWMVKMKDMSVHPRLLWTI